MEVIENKRPNLTCPFSLELISLLARGAMPGWGTSLPGGDKSFSIQHYFPERSDLWFNYADGFHATIHKT
jgi:hypothetical protein